MTPRSMLDTDIISYAMRGEGRAAERILSQETTDLCMSAVTLADLRYGATLVRSARFHRFLDAFGKAVSVMPFDEDCVTEFARIMTELTRRGTPIGDFDVLIAAHAVTLDVTLVTNDTKHFTRVRGLRVENWL
jgi:tRNA(fMet)-specific endonuclease VapC